MCDHFMDTYYNVNIPKNSFENYEKINQGILLEKMNYFFLETGSFSWISNSSDRRLCRRLGWI